MVNKVAKIFFTSDTHFGHQRTFDYSMRSMYFKDVEEMNNEMVRRWNEVVGKDDKVIHLGDFGDYKIAQRLNGDITLLFGNYERDGDYAITEKEKTYFSKVIERDRVFLKEKNSRINANIVELVHEPENRATDLFYLFGHIHEKQKVKINGLNVGVDVHNFAPVSEETVEFYRNAIENIYDDNCFLNY